jgi:site-specific DNA recombinase
MRRVAECDRKLNQYRAARHAGASPATVARWIAETEAEKARLQASQSRTAS